MMQNVTKKKRAAILCAAVIIAVLGIYGAVLFYPLLGNQMEGAMIVGVLLLYGLLIVALIAGVVAALYQRLKELEGGEEEDAKKY